MPHIYTPFFYFNCRFSFQKPNSTRLSLTSVPVGDLITNPKPLLCLSVLSHLSFKCVRTCDEFYNVKMFYMQNSSDINMTLTDLTLTDVKVCSGNFRRFYPIFSSFSKFITCASYSRCHGFTTQA